MYIQLYTKSVYSLLKSSLKIEDYVLQAKAYGMPSLALTDDLSVYGLIKFYKACKAHEIKPLLGVTLKMNYFELVLLAKNNQGYQNILALSTLAKLSEQEEITLDHLKKYAKDLVVILPTNGNKLANLISNNQFDFIKEQLSILKQEKMTLYIGVDLLNTAQSATVQKVNYIAKELNLPLVALNEVKYVGEQGYIAFRYLESINKGEQLLKQSLHLYSDSHDFVSPNMIDYNQPSDEAVKNTIKISEMCQVEIEFKQRPLPKFDTPSNSTSEEYLKVLCVKGLKKRLNNQSIPQVYKERLKYELKVISNMQFSDYFLIVYDFVKFAKQKDILVGPGRGSSAGSLVAYVLGITNVDPIRYHLLFERFLNPERITMPDIDLDFEDTRRDEVIKYVQNKYGKFNMSHIIAFGTFGTRSSLREVAKVMAITNTRLNQVLSHIDGMASIDANIEMNNQLKELIDEFNEIKYLFDIAKTIEGIPRNTTTHAAGIVLGDEPLTKMTALQPGLNGVLQSQYEAKDLEALGLIKMDFLGIRNLSMMKEITEVIQQTKKFDFDLNHIPLNDPLTYRLIASGETTGVFQLESEGMRQVLRDIRASEFEDIVAVNALFRPGPMDHIGSYIARKNKKEKITYLHPDLTPILEKTYGIIVYQEQIMQIAQKIADYSLGRADILRRAVSKKQRHVLEEERQFFITGALKKGYVKETAEALYEYIVKFGDYGFNRSHSVAYSVISYQMAYLKANYTTEFMAVLLSSVLGSEIQTYRYIKECRRYGVTILPVSIVSSHNIYVIEDNKSIRMSLMTLKGLGHNMSQAILLERENGPYRSFVDFVNRTRSFLKLNVFKALVYGGALDEFKLSKKAMIESYDKVVDLIRFNPSGYFDEQLHLTQVEEYSTVELMKYEKDVLGFYLTTHPMKDYLTKVDKKGFILPSETFQHMEQSVTLVAYVEQIKEIMTKTQEIMATLTISDDLTSIPAVIFPSSYKPFQGQLKSNAIYKFNGKINERNKKPQLVIYNAEIID